MKLPDSGRNGALSMKGKYSKLFVLLFIVIFVLSTVNMVSALGVTPTIPVENTPQGIAYDSVKGEIFGSQFA